MRRRRKLSRGALAVVASAALVLIAAGCGSSSGGGGSSSSASSGNKPPTNGVLTAALLGDIGQPPDPATFYAGNGIAIIKNVYEGLVQYANNTQQVQIVPQLATSWSHNKNYTVYTFQLRHGVTFHDGTPFTSAALWPSFHRAAVLNGGPAYLSAVVKSVATPSKYTAVVTLKSPNSAFLNYLASPFGPKMLSPTGLTLHKGTDYDQKYLASHDLGTGPYMLTEAEVGREYVLTRYDKYWGPKGDFETVDLPVYTEATAMELAFQKGAVDLIVGDDAPPSSAISQFSKNSSFSSYFLPMLTGTFIDANENRPFFSTQKARVAFMQDIDSKQMVDEVLNPKLASVATTMYAPGEIPGGADQQQITYNPSAMASYAKTLKKGTPMTIAYLSSVPNGELMANIIAAKMQALGIAAKVEGATTSEIFSWPEHPNAAPDVYIDASDGPDGGNPYMWGHVFWDKSGGIDLLQCNDPQVDSELDTAVETGSNAQYVEAAKQFSDQGCYLHVANLGDWVLAQKYLTGIPQAHNLGAFEVSFNLLGINKG
jgi:peptide/nickel transport system substrate-binding protein